MIETFFRIERRGFSRGESRALASAEIDRSLDDVVFDPARRRSLLEMGIGLGVALGAAVFLVGVVATLLLASPAPIAVAVSIAALPWGVALVQLARMPTIRFEGWVRRGGRTISKAASWLLTPSWLDLVLGGVIAVLVASSTRG
ncbi:MAG: hypothetical protein HGA44_12145 [Cellulomonadaceae bacterium]|nr:hypothetical protein [Cellulomonadaceae bacterium]